MPWLSCFAFFECASGVAGANSETSTSSELELDDVAVKAAEEGSKNDFANNQNDEYDAAGARGSRPKGALAAIGIGKKSAKYDTIPGIDDDVPPETPSASSQNQKAVGGDNIEKTPDEKARILTDRRGSRVDNYSNNS